MHLLAEFLTGEGLPPARWFSQVAQSSRSNYEYGGGGVQAPEQIKRIMQIVDLTVPFVQRVRITEFSICDGVYNQAPRLL